MMHFVRLYCSNYACLRRIWLTAIEKVRNYRKIVCIKNNFKNGFRSMHTPHPIPLDPPLAINYTYHQKNLAYLSHLASLVLFLLTQRQSQKGGGGYGTTAPPLNKLIKSHGLFDHTDSKTKKKVFTSSHVLFSLKISV